MSRSLPHNLSNSFISSRKTLFLIPVALSMVLGISSSAHGLTIEGKWSYGIDTYKRLVYYNSLDDLHNTDYEIYSFSTQTVDSERKNSILSTLSMMPVREKEWLFSDYFIPDSGDSAQTGAYSKISRSHLVREVSGFKIILQLSTTRFSKLKSGGFLVFSPELEMIFLVEEVQARDIEFSNPLLPEAQKFSAYNEWQYFLESEFDDINYSDSYLKSKYFETLLLNVFLGLGISAIPLFLKTVDGTNISFDTQVRILIELCLKLIKLNFSRVLPEECIAELYVLRSRLSRQKNSNSKIYACLLWEIIAILFAIYVQMKIDNLFLPSKDKEIDE